MEMSSLYQVFFTSEEDNKPSSLILLPPGETFYFSKNHQNDFYILEGSLSVDAKVLLHGTYVSTQNSEVTNHSNIDVLFFLYQEPKKSGNLEIILKPQNQEWVTNNITGLKQTLLRKEFHSLYLVSFDRGTKIPYHIHNKGEEIFVLKGELRNSSEALKKGEWIRLPPFAGHAPFTNEETLILLRNGHLG